MTTPQKAPVGVITSRFPVISETFILDEMTELEGAGTPVELYPLLRERAPVIHPRARAFAARANHVPLASRELLAAQAWWLRRRPRTYLRIWRRALAENMSSPSFLARALFVIPKAAAFARRMERAGVRHIHAHYATHPALAAWAASELTSIPFSFTAHAHDLYVNRTMLGVKVRDAEFVRTISEHNRELLVRTCGAGAAGKTLVVRCGVDMERFRPEARRRANGSPLELVCVASLQEYKGHAFLLEALAILHRSGAAIRCTLVGDGELRRSLEAQTERLGLTETVEFAGAQPSDRVREFMRAADVAVLPSIVTDSGKMEGIPVALMEAMALELPVVATRISGIPELVDEASGLTVPQRDPQALAEAIGRLARDPMLRARLGRAGRGRVAADFDLSRNVERLRSALAAPRAS